LAPSLNGEGPHKKFSDQDSDLDLHQISSKSVNNFLRYRTTLSFWPNHLMGKNH